MRAGQGLREHLQEGAPVVGSPGSGVQAVGDPIEFVLAEQAEVGALGQVLSHVAVGVRTGTALPWAVRVTEVNLHAGLRSQIEVARHLLALVVGEALAQRGGNRIQR